MFMGATSFNACFCPSTFLILLAPSYITVFTNLHSFSKPEFSWDCHSFASKLQPLCVVQRHAMIVAPAVLLGLVAYTNAYWLMGVENFITTERIDPVITPGRVSNHVHSVLGGSNFRMSVSTASLRQSSCTSIPIPQDKSNYWFPHMYFQWKNGSVTSLNGGAVIYYLFSDKQGTTTAFPDDFRMVSGDMTLRSFDSKSFAQQAVSFLCLDFNGVTTKHTGFPLNKLCPSGIRAQINFPSCWDGKRTDSPDHKSHVAFLSNGPDSGICSDPKYPVVIPRIFIEVYWDSHPYDALRNQALNPSQPFVFANGDSTGYGYHADFVNGWEPNVLQNAVDNCHCNPYGDPTCCANQGIFSMTKGKKCRITRSIDETTTGTLPKLPGNNPVIGEGKPAPILPETSTPALVSPVYVYTGETPTAVGTVVTSPVNQSFTPAKSETKATPSSSIPPNGPQPVFPTGAAATSSLLPPSTVAPPAVEPTSTRPVRPRSNAEDKSVSPDNASAPDADSNSDDSSGISRLSKRRQHNHRKFHSHNVI